MELLEKELCSRIEKLKNKEVFKEQLESLSSIYPFSKYEYVISKLLTEKNFIIR